MFPSYSSNKVRNPYRHDDLQSEFDEQSDVERKRKRNDFMEKEYPGEEPKKKRGDAKKWFQDEHGRMHRQMSRMMSLNAYQRHKEIINLYYISYPGSTKLLEAGTSQERTDFDVLKDNHKFVWSEEDESKSGQSWETRMAKKYYDKLFKEYCIADLTMYKHNKIGLRWRTEKEVKEGKGQFVCGTRKCNETRDLKSWEVNFAYKEDGERKNTLVKVKLCPNCSELLNYGSQKRQVQKKKTIRNWEKEKRRKEKAKLKSDEHEEQDDDKAAMNDEKTNKAAVPTSSLSSSTDVWEGPVRKETDKTIDDEIDEFLDDLFD